MGTLTLLLISTHHEEEIPPAVQRWVHTGRVEVWTLDLVHTATVASPGCRRSPVGSAARHAVEEAMERLDKACLVETVEDLVALLARLDQTRSLENNEVVGDCRAAKGDAQGDLADVELFANQEQDQILPGRASQRIEQVAACHKLVAQLAQLGAQRVWRQKITLAARDWNWPAHKQRWRVHKHMPRSERGTFVFKDLCLRIARRVGWRSGRRAAMG
jgi:hypothetical protein